MPDVEVFTQELTDINIEHWKFYEEIGFCRFNPRAIGRISISWMDEKELPAEAKAWLARWRRR